MEAIKTDKRIKAFFKSIFKKKRYDPSECFPFEELPPELMFNVFIFLRSKDLKNARLVSRNWNYMANDEGVWAYLYTNHFGPIKPIDKPWKKSYLEMRKEMKALESPFARLIWGIRKHHDALVVHLVSSGKCTVEPTNATEKLIPLYIAAQVGSKTITRFLLQRGAQVNIQSSDGSTPLYIAAQEGHSDVVEQLLSRSADIECVFRDGYTPLYIAAQNGRVEVVKTLLAKGANREASCSHGSTPLYIACQQGQLEVAKVLLEAKCNIEAVFKTGFTPLYVAAR
jgi:hypothetical protein